MALDRKPSGIVGNAGVTKAVLKAVIKMMEKEFEMATAGAGIDEKDELDDGDL